MLSVVDILVVVGLLVLFLLIGFFLREKESTNVKDYFLAGRKMSAIPAAFSICVSFMSSFTFTIYIGEIYSFGIPMYIFLFVSVLIAPLVTNYFQPVLYDSPHVSVYQHLEERFSKAIRLVHSVIFLCTSIFTLGVVGYAASITGEILADFPFWVSALCVGLLSTLYSTIGGLKAVIWTDVCQAIIMLFFFCAIIVKVLVFFGGISEPWEIIKAGERFQFSFQEGATHRYSVPNVFTNNAISMLYMMCISQPGVQRWRSVGSLREAKKTAVFTFIIHGILSMLVYVSAVLLYAFYARCSEDGPMPKPQMMSLHFVARELASWPGMKGLCFGSILSGALSTFSSFVNSMAAVTLEDLIKLKYNTFTPKKELLLSKILTAFYGVLCTGLIFVAARSSAVMMIYAASYAVSIAPPLGAFVLSLWSRRSNTVGVIAGTIISVAFLLLLSVASLLKGNRHVPLPDINPMCLSNDTLAVLASNVMTSPEPESSFLQVLSDISFCWYALIGTTTMIIFGYLFSLCTRTPEKGKSKLGTELLEVYPDGLLPNSSATEKLMEEPQT